MSQFPRCTITLFILLLLFPFAMSVIMASFYLDQLYHPKGDTIRTFGGTQSLFIQYLSGGGGGVTCLAMVYVCYCNDCDDNKSSKLNKQQKFVQTGNKTTEEESTKYQ